MTATATGCLHGAASTRTAGRLSGHGVTAARRASYGHDGGLASYGEDDTWEENYPITAKRFKVIHAHARVTFGYSYYTLSAYTKRS